MRCSPANIKIKDMAKFDAKKADLNKDGQLSDYEKNRGKATATAMQMSKGYNMQMGKREIDSPGTFSTKQSKIMQMARLGPMLQTENENGLKEVNRTTESQEKMVQGLLGEELKTPIDLASDPTTTTIPGGTIDETVYTTGKSLEGLTQEQLDWRTNEIEKLGGIDAYHRKYGSKEKGKARTIQTTTPDQTVETPGETAQEKETEFKPYPFKDTYDPFEARQEGRNIKATQRKLKREKIREARAQAKVDGKKGKEKREAVKNAKAQAKLDQRKATKKGMEDIATSVSTQVEKAKNPAQTDSYQAKPVMQMKPMQFRNVAYSGKKPGKSGYKK
jgi:hypothetical protein